MYNKISFHLYVYFILIKDFMAHQVNSMVHHFVVVVIIEEVVMVQAVIYLNKMVSMVIEVSVVSVVGVDVVGVGVQDEEDQIMKSLF